MQFPLIDQIFDHMAEILKQRISVNAHHGQHRKRKQRYRHHNDTDRAGHRNDHQLRIT